MADRTIAERLQPSLLDRLTNARPDEREDRREDRAIDVRRLRGIIERDLSWLLNTTSHESLVDLEAYPHVRRSVINFGLREVAGGVSGGSRAQDIRGAIQRAIERFEPRLRAGSVQVTIRPEGAASGATLGFDIRADMWAQPIPVQLYLRTKVNVATGKLTVEQAG
jgi:type VI secretion system protein ImpF